MKASTALAVLATSAVACWPQDAPLPLPKNKTWLDATCWPPEARGIASAAPCLALVDSCAQPYRVMVEVDVTGHVQAALAKSGDGTADCTREFDGWSFKPARNCRGDAVPGVYEQEVPGQQCIDTCIPEEAASVHNREGGSANVGRPPTCAG
jgi:hypothetical protein